MTISNKHLIVIFLTNFNFLIIFALFSLKIKISEAALWVFVSQKINSFAEIDLDNLFHLFIYAFLAENYE